MNQNLLSTFRNSFFAGILALIVTGCGISKRIAVTDFGKYRANIFFQFGSSKLTEESSNNLEVIVATIKQYLESARRRKPRNILVEIWGDASEEKTEKGKKANKKIKAARAENVLKALKEALEKEGIISGVELKVVDGPEVEEETVEEKEEGYKRAVLDITFLQNRKPCSHLISGAQAKPENSKASEEETSKRRAEKRSKSLIKRWFSKSKA